MPPPMRHEQLPYLQKHEIKTPVAKKSIILKDKKKSYNTTTPKRSVEAIFS